MEGFALWAKAGHGNGGLGWETDEDWIGVVYLSGGMATLVCGGMLISSLINWLGDSSTVTVSNIL